MKKSNGFTAEEMAAYNRGGPGAVTRLRQQRAAAEAERTKPVAIRPRVRATPISREEFLARTTPYEVSALSRLVAQGGPNNKWLRRLRDDVVAALATCIPAVVGTRRAA